MSLRSPSSPYYGPGAVALAPGLEGSPRKRLQRACCVVRECYSQVRFKPGHVEAYARVDTLRRNAAGAFGPKTAEEGERKGLAKG